LTTIISTRKQFIISRPRKLRHRKTFHSNVSKLSWDTSRPTQCYYMQLGLLFTNGGMQIYSAQLKVYIPP